MKKTSIISVWKEEECPRIRTRKKREWGGGKQSICREGRSRKDPDKSRKRSKRKSSLPPL